MDSEARAKRLQEIQSVLTEADNQCTEEVRKLIPNFADTDSIYTYIQQTWDACIRSRGPSNYCEAIHLLEQPVKILEEAVLHRDLDHIFPLHVHRTLINKIRDSLIIRIQLSVDIGNRQLFKEALAAAYGEDDLSNPTTWSQMMQSYKKQIKTRFPEEAFDSKNETRKKSHGHTRPARLRKKHCTKAWPSSGVCFWGIATGHPSARFV